MDVLDLINDRLDRIEKKVDALVESRWFMAGKMSFFYGFISILVSVFTSLTFKTLVK
jgi:hypothetical protein